eukprot:PhF_6_TR40471/c0_g1_i1/m.60497/K14006/SEC23; protein transport protein SEC23
MSADQAGPTEDTRWSFDLCPLQRIDATRMVIPLGCLLTPLKEYQGLQTLRYEPLRCKVCQAVLNPYCIVDYRARTWVCCFCTSRTALPVNYAEITEKNLPPEMVPKATTINYKIANPSPAFFATPIVFLFVVDLCVPTADEMTALKEHLLRCLNLIPQDAHVGFITYGTTVQLHEISPSASFSRCHAFRGSSEVTSATLKEMLNLPGSGNRFTAPLSDAEFLLTTLIDELEVDRWPVPRDNRPMRCTGAAVSVAASLLDVLFPNIPSRIVNFVSGVCSEGPGRATDISKENLIRGHGDIRDSTPPAKYWTTSCAFYDTIMKKMVVNSHVLDVFSSCLDQTGIAEMKNCIQYTGGTLLMIDSWKKPHFKTSLTQYFAKDDDGMLRMAFNTTLEVQTSPNWKVMGAIGPCTGGLKKSACVSETELGMGNTCQWVSSAMDENTTIAVYFDAHAVSNEQAATAAAALPSTRNYRFVQFTTKYLHSSGETHLRVTTLAHQIQHTTNFPQLAQSFDQETASVLVARLCAFKTETMAMFDVLRWLDRHLIRFVSKFADYTKDDPGSLRLNQKLSFFPVFMYHLRRSPYLQYFNSSPDETANYRVQLFRAPLKDSMLMIHPTLLSFTMTEAPRPVPLDEAVIQAENILVLDTFFEVLIHHGSTIDEWRRAGYEENPEFAHFKKFLEIPREHAKEVMKGRQPFPILYECARGSPPARILMNKINPSKAKTSKEAIAAGAAGAAAYGKAPDELMWTDDVTLQTFTEHLKKVAVQGN